MMPANVSRTAMQLAALAVLAAAAGCAGGSPTEPQLGHGPGKNGIATAWEARPSIFTTAWEARPTRIAADVRTVATAWEARPTDPVTQRAKVATGTFQPPIDRGQPTALKVRR